MRSPAEPASRDARRESASRAIACGMVAFTALLAAYFGALALLSGWPYALDQFGQFGQYVVPLAAGFGLQVSLFVRLRQLLPRTIAANTVVAASGTTSTAAMVSCCAHYLVTIAPVLGAAGLVSLAAELQVQFFWAGLAFNAAGIAYIGNKLWKAIAEHSRCAHA